MRISLSIRLSSSDMVNGAMQGKKQAQYLQEGVDNSQKQMSKNKDLLRITMINGSFWGFIKVLHGV